MRKEYITWEAFINNVEKIIKQYIGTCNKNAYTDIAEEIQKFINDVSKINFCSEIKSIVGQLIFDTRELDDECITETSNIGELILLEYRIIWKLNKNGKPTDSIDNIEIMEKAPNELKHRDMVNIPQIAHYLLAKQKRQRILASIAKYEELVSKRRKGLYKFEEIMISEAWNKTVLLHDLEYKGEE